MHFAEFAGFGLNWLTASFLVVSAITLWQYRAFTLQAMKMWRERSAQSLSVTMATAVFFISVATLWYGLAVHEFTIAFTGGLSVPSAFIALGAWKFGTPSVGDRIYLGITVAWSTLMLSSIEPGIVYAGFGFGMFVPIGLQIRELYATRDRGVLHPEWLAVALVKNLFLVVYGFAANDLVYMWFSPVFLVLSAWQMWLWWSFGPTATKRQVAVL